MMTKKFLGLTALIFPITTFGQDDNLLADGFDNLNLDACVITATKTPQKLADIPVITSVVTAKEIERIDATSINDVLEATIPGIEFTTAMNGTPVINFQGMGGNDILFLVDGERMAGETLNNIDFDRINVSNIERIEYVKGAASALYGSNAIGGVINIITKNANQPFALNLNGHYGKYNNLTSGLSLSLKGEKLKSVTNLQYKRKDTYDLNGSESSQKYENRIYGGNNKSVSEKLTYCPTKNWTLTGRGSYYKRLREYHSYQGYDHQFQDITAGLESITQLDSANTLTASYYFDRYWKDVVYVDYDKPNERKYENNQQTTKLIFGHDFKRFGNVTIGGEFFYEYMLNDQFEIDLKQYVEEHFASLIPFDDYMVELQSGSIHGTHHAHTFSAFIQHDVNLSKSLNTLYAIRYDNHSSLGGHISPKINLIYKVKPFNVRAAYSAGFRTPTLKEMYSDYDMGGLGMFRIMGNPDLKPEVSNNFSLSLEYRRNKWCANIEGYYLNKNDYIDLVYNEKGDSCFYTNTAKMNVKGVNAHAEYAINHLFKTDISYSYVNDKYQNVGFSKSRPHSGTLNFSYTMPHKKWYALSASIAGKVKCGYHAGSFDKDGNKTGSAFYPAYSLWNLNTRHSLGKAVTLIAGIDNLFNYKPKSYNNVTSVYTEGIEFHCGFSIDIDKWFKINNNND